MSPATKATTKPGDSGLLSTLLATVGGNLFMVFGTLLFGTLAVLLSWLPPRGDWVYVMARIWSRGLLLFSGVELEVERRAWIDPTGCYIFMSNHQSLYDIPALIASLPGQARFLAKRSLFRIPVFGWALRAGGFISIDRHDRSRATESFMAAARRLKEGASAVVFPEGTRSLDGQLLPFERGGFLLALRSGIPIVPVGVRGSLAVQRRGSHKVRPGRIGVVYGRPIVVDTLRVRSREELVGEVRREIGSLAGLQP